MLKLPRTTLDLTAQNAVESFLQSDLRPLFDGSDAVVSYLPFKGVIEECLRITARTGCIVQGLESIAKLLAQEKKGLSEVQKRTQQPVANRMSRLLLISQDGSERFYRQVNSLLAEYVDRLWCIRMEVESAELGSQISTQGNPAKAILISDKKALGLFLTELSRLIESKTG